MNKAEFTQFLTDQPNIANEDIAAAIKAGLTITDLEWNQRLDRDWLFFNKDAKAETKLREEWYVSNGVEPDAAKAYVAQQATAK